MKGRGLRDPVRTIEQARADIDAADGARCTCLPRNGKHDWRCAIYRERAADLDDDFVEGGD